VLLSQLHMVQGCSPGAPPAAFPRSQTMPPSIYSLKACLRSVQRDANLLLPHREGLPRPAQRWGGGGPLRLRLSRQRGQLGLQLVAAAAADGPQKLGGIGGGASLAPNLVLAVPAAAGRESARWAGTSSSSS
jgi:hypothetical protein